MAMAFGPERAMDAAPLSIDPSEQPPSEYIPRTLSTDERDPINTAPDAPQPCHRAAAPSPLPPFVFPALPASSSAPSSFSRASGRRPRSVIETHGGLPLTDDGLDVDVGARSAPLPSFNFNPGASLAVDKSEEFLSPPISPQSPQHSSSPSKVGGHGHRRGGSEFVGGNLRSGESITIMNTSPIKAETETSSSPAFQPPQLSAPPPGGRRHKHRRSAAISSHDLTLILQPPKPANVARGSSAPTSPATDVGGHALEGPSKTPPELPLPLTPNAQSAEAAKSDGTESPEKSPRRQKNATPQGARPVPRARVGFSDTLEFIPRPLSLVSSDASSTATARPSGHSVSGSLSSVVSANDDNEKTAVLTKDEPRKTPTLPAAPQTADSRPSTAGAILERSQDIQSVNHNGGSPRRRNSNPTLTGIPDATTEIPSNPSPTKTPKRWSLFGLEPFSAHQPPTRPRTGSSGSNESLSKPADASSTASGHYSDAAADATDSAPAPPDDQPPQKKKPKKRKKKVKAWAGSILKSKSKSRVHKKNKDPGESGSTIGDNSTELASSESTQHQIVSSPMTPTLTVTDSSGFPQNTQQWKPRSASTPEDDFALAMIDLDAALGPFNTPLPNNPEWDAAQKAAGPNAVPPKRQLHSAQGLRGFSGPGMHYHRRTESAPEMPPFEMGRFGIPRFGSSSTMADVFEEEEEEDEEEEGDEEDEDEEDDSITNVSSAPSKESSRGVSKQDAAEVGSDEETPPATTAPTNAILGPSGLDNADADKTRHATSMKSERSINSLQDQVIIEEPGGVDFRTGSVFQPRDDSTGSSTPSPRRALGNGDMAPLDVSPLHLPVSSTVPVSPYSTSHASSFPSPRSPMSYDAHRISTAPSSVNEENNFQSLLLGEPGPEVRLSVDMPPSLTSSNSTMTRDSTFIPPAQPRPRKPNRPEERPASVSSTAFGRRRSSLASLSRLISSSHGERSKLSMEVPMDDDGDKKQRSSRTKRLSRMMQFWKSKEESQT